MRSSTMLTLTVLCAICIPMHAAQAQPHRGLAQAEPGITAPTSEDNPVDHLRRQLETIDAERTRLHEAINRLDAGEPWDEVRADMHEQSGPGDDGPRPRERFQNKMDEPRIIKLFREIDPESAERLEQMRRRNPRMARRHFQSMAPRLHKLAKLRDSNPELFEVEAEQFRNERRIMRSAMEIHAVIAGDDESDPNTTIEATRDRLRELIARQVDLQIEGQRLQLESARDRIERLSAEIDKRMRSRDAMIDEHVARIMERAVRSGVNRRNRSNDNDPPTRSRRRRPGRP